MKLHLPKKRAKGRWYCGPHAIGAITGESFETVRAAINRYRGRAPNIGVTGMHSHEGKAALNYLGYDLDKRYHAMYGPGEGPPTFKQWLKRPRNEDQIWLVELTTHYVIVQGDWFIDNHTEGKTHVAYAPHQRARVKRAYVAHRMQERLTA